jgi:hypothetical protein
VLQHQLAFSATEDVRQALASIGRTEDVTLSHDGRRLAIAGFGTSTCLFLDMEMDFSAGRKDVLLSNPVRISWPGLKTPHGIAFLDREAVLVADRGGAVSLVRIPSAGSGQGDAFRIEPMDVSFQRTAWPGSVAVIPRGGDRRDILVCNNYRHRVSRHRLRVGARPRVTGDKVLLKAGLNIPDGIAVSPSERWIAISNHGTGTVLLFRNTWLLNRRSAAAGELRDAGCPHGVRFTPDGRHILVADAGRPFVKVYAASGEDWRGPRESVTSFPVMDAETFARGNVNSEEGGPKGIDVDAGMNVLVTTNGEQPLAFFDLKAVLGTCR